MRHRFKRWRSLGHSHARAGTDPRAPTAPATSHRIARKATNPHRRRAERSIPGYRAPSLARLPFPPDPNRGCPIPAARSPRRHGRPTVAEARERQQVPESREGQGQGPGEVTDGGHRGPHRQAPVARVHQGRRPSPKGRAPRVVRQIAQDPPVEAQLSLASRPAPAGPTRRRV